MQWKNNAFSPLFCAALFMMAVLCLTMGCKRKSVAPAPDVLADFETFYDKFHSDEPYQLAHIRFPLEGFPAEVDSSTYAKGHFYWRKEDWIAQRPIDTIDYVRTWQMMTPTIVIETVRQKGTPYGMVRRFLKDGNDWYLIFYSDMNRIK